MIFSYPTSNPSGFSIVLPFKIYLEFKYFFPTLLLCWLKNTTSCLIDHNIVLIGLPVFTMPHSSFNDLLITIWNTNHHYHSKYLLGTRHFMYINLFNPHNNPRARRYYLQMDKTTSKMIGENTNTQRGAGVCSAFKVVGSAVGIWTQRRLTPWLGPITTQGRS